MVKTNFEEEKEPVSWICPICNDKMIPEVDETAYSEILDSIVHADCLIDSE